MNVQSSTLWDYLQVLRRRKWIVVAVLVAAPAAAVAVAILQQPRYSASAEVLLSRQTLAYSLNNVTDPTTAVDPQWLVDTQTSVAQSPEIARGVIAAGHLKTTPVKFLENSSVTSRTGTDVLVFTVKDRHAANAQALATLYARQYIDFANTLSTQSIRAARSEVDSKIATLEGNGNGRGALYADLLSKDQQLATMEALQTGNATLIKSADNASQTQPTPVKDGLLGLLVGIVLGLGLAFLRDHLDTRIAAPPRSPSGSAYRSSPAFGAGAQSAQEQSARHGRRAGESGRRAVPRPGDEPRVRHARAAAEDDHGHERLPGRGQVDDGGQPRGHARAHRQARRTRRPRPAAAVRPRALPRSPGARPHDHGNRPCRARGRARLLPVGPAALAGADDGPQNRLQVLCSGRIPPNPGEFIRSRGVGRLILHLSEVFDTVVIDSAPLLGLGDSLALIPRVDAVVLVTRLELLRRPTVDELHRVLSSSGATALGIVVTAAQQDESEGYGYGYGYGDTATVPTLETVGEPAQVR